MQPFQVVVFQGDMGTARCLAAALAPHLDSIHIARRFDEACTSVARHRANALIVDMEVLHFSEIAALRREFPGLTIICTHRLADEEMWTAAIEAGATDMCTSGDAAQILQALLNQMSRMAAAA